tara:strand:+ start:91 stop:1974 length:1884 start_codon:yes stop_codon:yes gene_type:complete
MPSFNNSNVQQLSAVSDNAARLIGGGNPLQAGREQIAGQKAMQDDRLAQMKEEADKNKAHEQLLQSSQQKHSAGLAAKAELGVQKRHAATIGMQEAAFTEQKRAADLAQHNKDTSEGLALKEKQIADERNQLQEHIDKTVDPATKVQLVQQLRQLEGTDIDIQTKLALIQQFVGRSKDEQSDRLRVLTDAHADLDSRITSQMNIGADAADVTAKRLGVTAEDIINRRSSEGQIASGGGGAAIAQAANLINQVTNLLGTDMGAEGYATEQALAELAAEIGIEVPDDGFIGSAASEILMNPEFRKALGRHIGLGMVSDLAQDIAGASGGKIDSNQLTPVLNNVIKIAMGGETLNAVTGKPMTLAEAMQNVQSVAGTSQMVIEGAFAQLGQSVGILGNNLAAPALQAMEGGTGREAGMSILWGLFEGPEGGLNPLGMRKVVGEAFGQLSTGLSSMSVQTRSRESHLADTRKVLNNISTFIEGGATHEQLDQFLGQGPIQGDAEELVGADLLSDFEQYAGEGAGYGLGEEMEDQRELADALKAQLGISGQGSDELDELLGQSTVSQTGLLAKSQQDLSAADLGSPESLLTIAQAHQADQGVTTREATIAKLEKQLAAERKRAKRKFKWTRR